MFLNSLIFCSLHSKSAINLLDVRIKLNSVDYSVSGTTLTISGEGIVDSTADTYIKNNNIETVNIADTITQIGNRVFFRLSTLKSINLPNTITEIGNYSFNSCSQLGSIQLPSFLKKIGKFSFHALPITSISLPDNLETIGEATFVNCGQLTNIQTNNNQNFQSKDGNLYQGNKLLVWVGGNQNSAVSLSDVEISDYAFFKNQNIQTVELTNAKIGKHSFSMLNKMWKVTISGNPVSIDDLAFDSTYSLYEVNINCEISYLGVGIFRECTKLTNFVYSGSYTDIPDSTFFNCPSISSIPFSKVKTIGPEAFKLCVSLNNGNLPSTLESIGDYAFYGCTGLKSLSLPASLTKIGDYAFYGCSNLGEISSASSKFVIADNVLFTNDTLILYPPTKMETEYTVPENIKNIQSAAFAFSQNLVKVTAKFAEKFGAVSFSECQKLMNLIVCTTRPATGNIFQWSYNIKNVTVPLDYPADNFGELSVDKVDGYCQAPVTSTPTPEPDTPTPTLKPVTSTPKPDTPKPTPTTAPQPTDTSGQDSHKAAKIAMYVAIPVGIVVFIVLGIVVYCIMHKKNKYENATLSESILAPTA